jgi:hypothetical protein
MATVSRIVDDLNPELDATTRTFRLFDTDYEIDLSDGNAHVLAEALNVLSKARPVNGRSGPKTREGGISSNRGSGTSGNGKSISRKRTAKVTAVRKPRNTRAKKAVDGAPPAVVRKWAQQNGVEVSATGVIQQATYDAYNKFAEARMEKAKAKKE